VLPSLDSDRRRRRLISQYSARKDQTWRGLQAAFFFSLRHQPVLAGDLKEALLGAWIAGFVGLFLSFLGAFAILLSSCHAGPRYLLGAPQESNYDTQADVPTNFYRPSRRGEDWDVGLERPRHRRNLGSKMRAEPSEAAERPSASMTRRTRRCGSRSGGDESALIGTPTVHDRL
jgi:hypothetical protein